MVWKHKAAGITPANTNNLNLDFNCLMFKYFLANFPSNCNLKIVLESIKLVRQTTNLKYR